MSIYIDWYKVVTHLCISVTIEDCALLESMNKATQEKYGQLGQMNQRIMKEIAGLQTSCKAI